MIGDSTVPPTTGIISNKVGVAKMAFAFGSIFIGHQLGAFASAWLGGILVSTMLGYTAGLLIGSFVQRQLSQVLKSRIKAIIMNKTEFGTKLEATIKSDDCFQFCNIQSRFL